MIDLQEFFSHQGRPLRYRELLKDLPKPPELSDGLLDGTPQAGLRAVVQGLQEDLYLQGTFRGWPQLREVLLRESKGDPRMRMFTHELLRMLRVMHVWKTANFPVFVLDPKFCTAMHFTDYGDTLIEEAKFPFDTGLVVIPTECQSFIPADHVFFHHGKEGSKMLVSSRKREILWRQIPHPALWRDFSGFKLEDDGGLATQFEIGLDGSKKEMPAIEFDSYDDVLIRRACHVTTNTCIYLNEVIPNALPKRKGVSVNDVHADGPSRWVVGRDLKISMELHQAALDGGTSDDIGSSFKVKHRFVVRGHWRNQVHGTARLLRRRTWIQPFWKGPDGAEAIQHIYNFDGGGGQ